MENEIVYEHENLRMEYSPKGNYIHETWWGTTLEKKFSELLMDILKVLREKQATGIILDAREHKGLSPQSQQEAAQKIGEYGLEVGQLKQAIIVPKDVFSKFSVDNYNKKLGDNSAIITRYFDEVDSAKEWMKTE